MTLESPRSDRGAERRVAQLPAHARLAERRLAQKRHGREGAADVTGTKRPKAAAGGAQHARTCLVLLDDRAQVSRARKRAEHGELVVGTPAEHAGERDLLNVRVRLAHVLKRKPQVGLVLVRREAPLAGALVAGVAQAQRIEGVVVADQGAEAHTGRPARVGPRVAGHDRVGVGDEAREQLGGGTRRRAPHHQHAASRLGGASSAPVLTSRHARAPAMARRSARWSTGPDPAPRSSPEARQPPR